ncbi:MAG: ferrochelatase [bacterium]
MNTVKANKKIAVLLLAFGGPVSSEEVEPFIKNVTGGEIAPDKIQMVLERYKKIGGKSPLLEITQKQADLLQEMLNQNENRFLVFVGMRYWRPFIADTLKTIISNEIEKIIVLPMTPYYSRASTGGYYNDFLKSLSQSDKKADYIFIKNWHDHPLFIKAFTESIIEQKNKFLNKDPEIIFSAHSIPEKFINEGDPYVSQIKETIEAVLKNTGLARWHLAFQSRGLSSMEWIGPEVSYVLEKIKNTNKKDVLLVPIGFISDHIETLYDIDILYKNEASRLGLNFRRVPSLNTNPTFIKSLEGLVRGYLQEDLK